MSLASVTGGNLDFYRGLFASSSRVADGTLLYALEGTYVAITTAKKMAYCVTDRKGPFERRDNPCADELCLSQTAKARIEDREQRKRGKATHAQTSLEAQPEPF